MLQFLRQSIVRHLIIPPITLVFVLSSCGFSDHVVLERMPDAAPSIGYASPGQLVVDDGDHRIVDVSLSQREAGSSDPVALAYAADFRLQAEAGRAIFSPESMALLASWSEQLKDGGPRSITLEGARASNQERVSAVLTADRLGIIYKATFSDASGTTEFDFAGASSDISRLSQVTRREGGRTVFAMGDGADYLTLGSQLPSAQAGSGPCWMAVMAFFAALAAHEGGTYILALGIGGFIGLGPVAMGAVVLVMMGTGGAVGVAAGMVNEDCLGGSA